MLQLPLQDVFLHLVKARYAPERWRDGNFLRVSAKATWFTAIGCGRAGRLACGAIRIGWPYGPGARAALNGTVQKRLVCKPRGQRGLRRIVCCAPSSSQPVRPPE